jgi:DNA-binding response OmpR family regulator
MAQTCVIGEADPFIGRLLRRFAEKSGLEAIGVQLGQEMLELINQTKPAVIVFDPELPGLMRGWEAIRAIRANSTMDDVPVIVCSWLKEAEARALVGEISGYLQKPELHYEDFAMALKQAGVT